MKLILLSYILFTTFLIDRAIGQSKEPCDKIYDYVEVMPIYLGGDSTLSAFTNKEIIPIIAKCIKRDSVLTASAYMMLVIDKSGSIQDVTFTRISASEKCKMELKNHLLTLKNWKPAIQNNKPVCCNLAIPISCIYWQ